MSTNPIKILVAFALPFLMIVPPVLESIRGLHSPQLTINALMFTALFVLPFSVVLMLLNRRTDAPRGWARIVSALVIGICAFGFLDIAFGGVTIAASYLPVLETASLIEKVAIHFALMAVAIVILSGIAWVMYNDILNLLLILFGIIAVSSVFLTEQKPYDNWSKPATVVTEPSRDGPTEVYIILDAMMGLEGIDRSIPGGQEFYDEVKAFHEKHGFALHANAFSRQGSTASSLPPAVNYDYRGMVPDAYLADYNGYASVVVNALFEDMASNGRGLKVYQTPYLNFCQVETVSSCNTLGIFDPFNGYLPPEISENEAFLTLIGMKRISLDSLSMTYVRLFLKNAFPRSLARSLFSVGEVPETGNYNGLSFDRYFAEFSEDLIASRGKTNYFAHFVVPHDPFILDAECRPKAAATGAMFLSQGEGIEGEEFEERRKAGYRDYFAQARCVYKQLDGLFTRLATDEAFDDVRIVLFGDHGSRNSAGKFARYLGERDLHDNYAILFSVWERGQDFEIVEQQASLQQLLSKRDAGFRFDPTEEIVKTVVAPQQKPGQPRTNVEIVMPLN